MTDTYLEMLAADRAAKKKLATMPEGSFVALGAPYCAGARATLIGGSLSIDLSRADLIDKRDRSMRIVVKGNAPRFSLGGVQTIQRIMRRAEH